jgi:hypothetical protein
MNDDLQKQVAETLRKAVAAAQQGGEWLAGQVPDVLHQLLIWTVVTGVLSALAFVALGVAWSLFVPRHFRWVQAGDTYSDRGLSYVPVGTAGFGSLFAFYCLGDSILNGLKAGIAPKLFLLEYAASLLK